MSTRSGKSFRRNSFFLLLILTLCLLPACSVFEPEPTRIVPLPISFPPITEETAVEIASDQLPPLVLARASVANEGLDVAGGYWLIVFEIPSTVTKEELGWLAVPGTDLFYPASSPGIFRVLYVRVDANTGEILLRQATEHGLPRITLGGIPEEKTSWVWVPVIGVAIMVFGLLIALWLIRRRRSTNHAPP